METYYDDRDQPVARVEEEAETGALDAPCGCPACDHRVQPGHVACEQSPPAMLEAEQAGRVVRAYDDGSWRWFQVR